MWFSDRGSLEVEKLWWGRRKVGKRRRGKKKWKRRGEEEVGAALEDDYRTREKSSSLRELEALTVGPSMFWIHARYPGFSQLKSALKTLQTALPSLSDGYRFRLYRHCSRIPTTAFVNPRLVHQVPSWRARSQRPRLLRHHLHLQHRSPSHSLAPP